jgi:hypothetical protein
MLTLPDGTPIPEGLDFIKLLHEIEENCGKVTDEQLLAMGVRAPETLKNLGTVLLALDGLASCLWGCKGDDHTIEYIAGRACSSAKAALRLLRSGYYDEALLIIRSIGEITNLLLLFLADKDSLVEWKSADKVKRQQNYRPVKVRHKLAELSVPLLVDERRYSELSEVAAHVTPQTKPQLHNLLGVPTIGGHFQLIGALVTLNELAGVTALTAFAAAKLINPNEEVRKRVAELSLILLRSVGGIDLLNLEQVKRKLEESTD